MKPVFEQRASTILFNLFRQLDHTKSVIVPANVCPIVAVTLMKAGQPFELVDINKETLCLDEEFTLHQIKKHPQKYAGVLFVHTYGNPHQPEPFFHYIKQIAPDILIIDDRCPGLPEFDLPPTAADAVIFSTGYAKYIELGFGGYGYIKPEVKYEPKQLPFNEHDHQALVEQERQAQETLAPFSYHDSDWLDTTKPKISFDQYKLEIIAKIPEARLHQQKLNQIYAKNIPAKYQLGDEFSQWRFSILVPDKVKLLRMIFDHGLFASSHYPSLNGIFGHGADQNAAKLHSQVVNLFNNHRYTEDQAKLTCDVINKHLKECA
ncbi:MAG: hypothetical protein WC773_03245 [Patescibacteria group bacterium]|jgi:hypothetical protein